MDISVPWRSLIVRCPDVGQDFGFAARIPSFEIPHMIFHSVFCDAWLLFTFIYINARPYSGFVIAQNEVPSYFSSILIHMNIVQTISIITVSYKHTKHIASKLAKCPRLPTA